MQERRILLYLSKDDIPSSAQEISIDSYFNVIYVPIGNSEMCFTKSPTNASVSNYICTDYNNSTITNVVGHTILVSAHNVPDSSFDTTLSYRMYISIFGDNVPFYLYANNRYSGSNIYFINGSATNTSNATLLPAVNPNYRGGNPSYWVPGAIYTVPHKYVKIKYDIPVHITNELRNFNYEDKVYVDTEE